MFSSSSGRASPALRKMKLHTDGDSDAPMPSRPKSPFPLPFRNNASRRDNATGSGISASRDNATSSTISASSSSTSSAIASPTSGSALGSPTQGSSRRGIFRKKSISSMSMMSINDGDGDGEGDGRQPLRPQQQTPASPSSPSSSRIPTRNGSASPSPAARKAGHRRSVSYSGIIESANRAQSEMQQQHQTSPSPPSQRSLHARSPSAASSRIPVSVSSDAAYTRSTTAAQAHTPTSPRRLYGQDDVQNYIRSGRPTHAMDPELDTLRSRTPTNMRPLQSHPIGTPPPSAIPRLSPPRPGPGHTRSPSLLERATRAASSGSISKFDDTTAAVHGSPSSDRGETEDLMSSSANTSANNSPRMGVKAIPPHDGRSVSVLGIRAEDELASQTASPTSRIPRSTGMRSQLSRSGSTSSRRSFFEWVSGSSNGNGSGNANDGAAADGDTSSIRSSSTQTNHTMTPSSSSVSSNQGAAGGGGGLKFPQSPLNFLRSSSALGHYPERSTTPIPKYPQPSARPRDVRQSHARTPSQVSMYSPSSVASPSLQSTPIKGQQQQAQQSPSSGIPFYRRLRTTSTSAKSLLNGGSGADRDNASSQRAGQPSQEQLPPRAPSAMSGFFSSLQKTKSKDELQAQHSSASQSKLTAFGGLRRNRADTSVPVSKRPTKGSISQPLERPVDHSQPGSHLQPRPSHEHLRSASAMSFRDDTLPSPQSSFSRLPFDHSTHDTAHLRRGSAATTTASTLASTNGGGPFDAVHSHRSKSPSLSVSRYPGSRIDDAAENAQASALRGRGLRKEHGGTPSNNSSRHSLFLPSTGNGGGAAGAGHLLASNLKVAGKRGWGMVKGWRGAGGVQTEDEDVLGTGAPNKARKNNDDLHQQPFVLGSSRPGSLHGAVHDAVLRKWASLPEVVPAALLASSPGTPESLIFGVTLRDAVIRTRLISPDVDEYLDAREKASSNSRDSRNSSVSSQASQKDGASQGVARRWHQSKRSVASKSDLSGGGAMAAGRGEVPSHLRKTMPQVHPRKRPSRIGILDLGSDFSLSSDFFGGEEKEWDTSYDSFHSVASGRSGLLESEGEGGASSSRAGRIPVDRLQARRQYLPRFVTRCIESLETFGLTEEGVYRLSGRSSHTNRLRALFDGRLEAVQSGEADDDFGWDLDLKSLDPIECDINSVCSALKAYLRELPTPVLDREHLKVVSSQAQKLERAKKATSTGPPEVVDREVVLSLFTDMEPAPWYLLRELAYHLGDLTQEGVVAKTKMTLSNLSLVLAPTLSIPVNALAFIVSQREALFQRAPRVDTQLDKVREGDVIGGVTGRESGGRLGRGSALASSSGASTPSSTASPSVFANSTFSFTMAPSPKLQEQPSSGDGSEEPPRLRPRTHLKTDTDALERSHYRDSSASDATILAGPYVARSPRVDTGSEGSLFRRQEADEEPREVLQQAGASYSSDDDEGRGVVGGARKPHGYSHSASNSGSTWGSSQTDSTSTSTTDTYRSQMSSANSLSMTSDEEHREQRQLPPPPPIAKDEGHWARLREKSSGGSSERDGDSTLSAPSSPAAHTGKRGGPAGVSRGAGMVPRSPSGTSYPSSPRSGVMPPPSPAPSSSSSLAHSQSYSSFASDEAGVPRSGRTSALDRPRPVPSGSGSGGSFFAGATGSSSGHGTVKRARGASVSRT